MLYEKGKLKANYRKNVQSPDFIFLVFIPVSLGFFFLVHFLMFAFGMQRADHN